MVALLRASFIENCVLVSDTCGGLKNCSQRSTCKADRPNGIKSNIMSAQSAITLASANLRPSEDYELKETITPRRRQDRVPR